MLLRDCVFAVGVKRLQARGEMVVANLVLFSGPVGELGVGGWEVVVVVCALAGDLEFYSSGGGRRVGAGEEGAHVVHCE